LTPNRGDAFSHIGVVRDLKAALSAVYNIKLDWTLPDFKVSGTFESPFSVEIKDTNACKRYSYVFLKNIKVTHSPKWLKNRLLAIGVKPINSIVDVTNFVLHELGQPLHAFDADKISNQKIIVKTLENTRKFVALDGSEKDILQSDLMICDDKELLCIAGVYGGLESGVNFDTKNVFLEAAFFDPIFIRKTATRLALRTDAAQRFEKTTDVNATIQALNRAVELLLSITSFEYSTVGDVFPNPSTLSKISTTFSRINKLSGVIIPKDKVTAILNDLGFELQISDDNLTVTVPSFKTEVTREADLLEEILRIYGYNTIPFPKNISMAVNQSVGTDSLSFENTMANLLVGAGYQEISTNSISSSKYSSDDTELVRLSNAQTSELDSLRYSLIYGHLEVVLSNINHKHSNLRLFESGNVYKLLNGKYEQQKRICLINTGLSSAPSWIESEKKFDFYSLKSDVESIIKKSLSDFSINDEEESTFFDYNLTYNFDNVTFAEVGQVNSQLLKKMGIKQTVFWSDINFDFLLEKIQYQKIKFKELNKFPAVQRDLSLVLDQSVKYKDIESLVSHQNFKSLHSISLFDIYKGDKIDASKKSYTIKFTFQDANKTLTDSDIDKYMNRLMMVFEKDLNAQIRKS
jgi:phenylalanyl-tRNA synthetase beta chain